MSTVKFTLEHLNEFSKRFKRESDRAVGVLAAAYLEECLKELLLLRIVEGSDSRLFGAHGPLATFSGKIDLAYAIGLLPMEVRDDMRRIKEVRNRFAHKIDDLTFEAPEIKAICGEFYVMFGGQRKHLTPARFAFEAACQVCVLHIGDVRDNMTKLTAPKAQWTVTDIDPAPTPAKTSYPS